MKSAQITWTKSGGWTPAAPRVSRKQRVEEAAAGGREVPGTNLILAGFHFWGEIFPFTPEA